MFNTDTKEAPDKSGFFKVPIRISGFMHVRMDRIKIIRIRDLWDLNDGFDKVLEEPDQDSVNVKSARYETYVTFFSTLTQVLRRFFTDPDFSGLDPDFWLTSKE